MQQSSVTLPWRAMASLRLTLVGLVLLALGVVYAYVFNQHATLALVLPLLLLSINLLVAVATRPIFRQSGSLLLFHLALISIVLLLAVGRLTYLKGHVELTQGQEFAGVLTGVDAGVWHRSALDQVRFSNEGFAIEYNTGLQRGVTSNQVSYVDAEGRAQRAEIGDQTPLVLHGYRFYTSHNKGFAPTFSWHPVRGGAPILGAVHLPSYPINEYSQSREWTLPGTGLKLWTMLQFDEVILDPARPSEFRLPQYHHVVVRLGDSRIELQPGGVMTVPEGRLVYEGLRSWMGYTVFYDWTIYWLLAACLLAIAAMAWYYSVKFYAKPWNE